MHERTFARQREAGRSRDTAMTKGLAMDGAGGGCRIAPPGGSSGGPTSRRSTSPRPREGRSWLEPPESVHSSIETVFRVLGGTWILTSVATSLLLNAYLKAIGQRGVPLDLVGTWATLALMGALLVGALAGIAATFASGEALMQPLHPGARIPHRTRATFLVASTTSLTLLFAIATHWPDVYVLYAVAVSIGVAAGVAVFRWRRRLRRSGTIRLMMRLAAWILLSAFVFMVLTVELDLVLRVRLDGWRPIGVALAVSLLLLTSSILLPKRWSYVASVATMSAITLAVSPGPYGITLIALASTNQGGGLPLLPLDTMRAATICNLGTSDRRILYRVPGGCDRKAAFEHLREITSATTSRQKAAIVSRWRCEIDVENLRPGKCSQSPPHATR